MSPGDTFEFQITGELLIRDTTNSVTFDAEVTFVDETRVEGSATANVLRSDFGIGIPSVPGVANVTDEVLLNIDFVALAG
jgi:polyisoprenoid-binding protein YceI